ncbi:MAG: maleylpyruvate isomerase family mycothiol-dependent enzyme [Microbacteriaceae bacterium]|nr:maleylpyruvate isomerase family mycothiol-dependent enzyme [Microbacteriaceae bacterium]
MNDLSQHFPLSQRPSVNETAVSGDWRPIIGSSLSLVAELLSALPPEQWESPSLCTGWTVRDVAGHLIWMLGSTRRQLASDVIRAALHSRQNPGATVTALAQREARKDTAALTATLEHLAALRQEGSGRHGIGDLTEVVVHGYDIASALGLPLAFSPTATGAVAVARAARAPAVTRTLLRARALSATDAGWSVGRGTPQAAPAAVLIPLLFGRNKNHSAQKLPSAQ